MPATSLVDGPQRDLWSLLAGRPILAATSDVPGEDFWDYLCLVDHAHASQYDGLRNLSGNPSLEACNLACLAVAGDGFHGQHGRPWRAEPGNLHLSVRMPVDLPVAGTAAAMMMLPAVALVRTLDDLADTRGAAGIKWVNDILLNGRKVGGVLTHARSCRGRMDALTFGLGLNLVTAPSLPRTRIPGDATCLQKEWGSAAGSLADVLPPLLGHLARLVVEVQAAGPTVLIHAYRERSLVVGRRVGIWLEGAGSPADREPDLIDRVLAVEDDLSLRLQDHNRPVTGGRLALLE